MTEIIRLRCDKDLKDRFEKAVARRKQTGSAISRELLLAWVEKQEANFSAQDLALKVARQEADKMIEARTGTRGRQDAPIGGKTSSAPRPSSKLKER